MSYNLWTFRVLYKILFSFESLLFPSSGGRPGTGQSNECTTLEYPVGIYYDFYKRKWLYKDSDKIVDASAWLIDPELNYYNPYMNDIVQVVREYVFAAGPEWTDLKRL